MDMKTKRVVDDLRIDGDRVVRVPVQLGLHATHEPAPGAAPDASPRSAWVEVRQGLQAGDRIVQAQGEPVADWRRWRDLIELHPDQPFRVRIERDGVEHELELEG